MTVLNGYSMHARLAPALLVISPVALLAVVSGAATASTVTAAIVAIATFGLPPAVAPIVRDAGVRVEDRLFLKWGGPPTTLLLIAQSGTSVSPRQRDRWRTELARKSGLSLAEADKDRSGEIIGEMTTWARESTRDSELVLVENKHYGFQRNLLAVRAAGIMVAVGSTAGFAGWSAATPAVRTAHLILVVLVGLLATCGWVFLPSEKRTRTAGYKYATTLFDAATGPAVAVDAAQT